MEDRYKIEREQFFRRLKEEWEEYYCVVKFEEEKNRPDKAISYSLFHKTLLNSCT